MILSLLLSIFVYKKNIFFKRFISIFFSLSFIFFLFKISSIESKKTILDPKQEDLIIFEDKLNTEKQNIYFFILDAMQPIDIFEDNNNFKLNKFILEYQKKTMLSSRQKFI